MIYGSVCSGIEAATVACKKCAISKPISAFHKKGDGYQAWCKDCHNAYQRLTRKRRDNPESKANQNYKLRYGMTTKQVKELAESQQGCCKLCEKVLTKFVVDHCHITKKVRGILCHRCNVIIGGMDCEVFREKALNYLKGQS